jgi:hypothetical protein
MKFMSGRNPHDEKTLPMAGGFGIAEAAYYARTTLPA